MASHGGAVAVEDERDTSDRLAATKAVERVTNGLLGERLVRYRYVGERRVASVTSDFSSASVPAGPCRAGIFHGISAVGIKLAAKQANLNRLSAFLRRGKSAAAVVPLTTKSMQPQTAAAHRGRSVPRSSPVSNNRRRAHLLGGQEIGECPLRRYLHDPERKSEMAVNSPPAQ